MRIITICTCVLIILHLSVVPGSPLSPPFDTEPYDTDCLGNCAGSYLGHFRVDGGPPNHEYYLGNNFFPGSLIMDFALPFTDGPDNDFAISTNSKCWGPQADSALIQFFFQGVIQASFIISLTPDQLLEFELPGSGLVADRVIVTNIIPDTPGVDELACMTFDDAGVAYLAANTIDINPNEFSNEISSRGNGLIPVAILTTLDFDSTTVDPLSVKFGPNEATEAHETGHFEDVNGDGMLDLILHFMSRDTGIQCGDTYASLIGETFDGQVIAGYDSIMTVNCK